MAIPTVNPSSTELGTNLIKFPSFYKANTKTMVPESKPSIGIAVIQYFAITGIKTTVIAPVGPLTCQFDPPKSAAMNPATIAVTMPFAALIPLVIPNPIASGNATIATVNPAKISLL